MASNQDSDPTPDQTIITQLICPTHFNRQPAMLQWLNGLNPKQTPFIGAFSIHFKSDVLGCLPTFKNWKCFICGICLVNPVHVSRVSLSEANSGDVIFTRVFDKEPLFGSLLINFYKNEIRIIHNGPLFRANVIPLDAIILNPLRISIVGSCDSIYVKYLFVASSEESIHGRFILDGITYEYENWKHQRM